MIRINVYAYDDSPAEPDDGFHDGYGYDPHFGFRNRETPKPELAGWFDEDKAIAFEECREFNGSNYISANTGTEWDHETLYRTAQGRWVMSTWSQRQGVLEKYWFITDQQAREWLLRNERDEEVARYFGEVEEERGPGRPEIGGAAHIRYGEERLTRVDAYAGRHGLSRADALRKLIDHALLVIEG